MSQPATSRLLGRLRAIFDEIVTARVLLSLKKIQNRADSRCAGCNIHVKGVDLFAKTSSQDLYAMIDELMEKMDGLVRKHKGKSKVHRDDAVKHAAVAAAA
jgi:putative sigma-54 modulation protein